MNPVFRKMTMKDKRLVESYFEDYQPLAGEMTFTNLHIWDNKYNTHISEINGFLCMLCGRDVDRFCLFPVYKNKDFKVEKLRDVVQRLARLFKKEGLALKFKRVTLEERELLLKAFDGTDFNVDCVYDRDNSDYVYGYEEMSTLKGKKYHQKRNHISYLLKHHEVIYQPITEENLADCTHILKEWHESRDDDPEMLEERISQQQLIDDYYRYSQLKGCIIRVDGRPKAYTIGDMLNKDTIVVHAEKADGTIRGLFPYVNQQFLQNQFEGAVWVNREQDCGSEGLRKAKLSYHPSRMIDKYVVTVK